MLLYIDRYHTYRVIIIYLDDISCNYYNKLAAM